MSDNNSIILVDSCESASSIDLGRAEKALARAKEMLKEATHADSVVDAERAHLALERAEARIQAAFLRGK